MCARTSDRAFKSNLFSFHSIIGFECVCLHSSELDLAGAVVSRNPYKIENISSYKRMGNSESHTIRTSFSFSESRSKRGLTQSVTVSSTNQRKSRRRQEQELINSYSISHSNKYTRSESFNIYHQPEMSRRLSGWRASQKRQKVAQWTALKQEKRMVVERERLFAAITAGEEQTVLSMLASGMDVNSSDENHLTALHYAAMCGRPEMIALLIENGADPNAYDMKGGFTPIHWIVINSIPGMGDFKRIGECLEALVRGGCDTNSKDFNQATPLHFAARKDDKMVVDALMRLGANPNNVDVLGKSCASVAKSEETKILIIKLADLRARAIYHVLEIPPSV